MQDLKSTTTPAVSAVPFSPLTDVGLSVAIEEHGSRVQYAITQKRHMSPVVIREAELVLAMCRARTDRMVRNIITIRGRAA